MDMQIQSPKMEISPNWAWRGRGFATILRMGHCAPAVMQALLDISPADAEQEWLIRLSSGMPGGIGNTGNECGAVTSPLELLGLRCGLQQVDGELPQIFDKGHALCRHFLDCHRTMQCREIRGPAIHAIDRFPRHCISPVARSAERFTAILDSDCVEAIPAASREAYTKMYAHLAENQFHCAHSVLSHLGYSPAENPPLFDAASAFIGGTLFMGMTCSALAAGVMAIGLKEGEIENSYLRVARLLAIMTAGGNAFDDRLNKFNRSMNQGNRLAKWFKQEFGSTQCRAITGFDFSSAAGVSKYMETDCVIQCRHIAEMVALKVQQILAERVQ